MTDRAAFESAISSPPYERDIARWPSDQSKFAWAGQYKYLSVSLAWDMWQEAARQERERCERLRAGYAEAIEDIADWGIYASEYFQQKHDLAGTIAKHRQGYAAYKAEHGAARGAGKESADGLR